jgi:predicted PurR-regulated permease PerM
LDQELTVMPVSAAPRQPDEPEPVDPQVARARAAWAQLGLKLQRITPSQLFRFLLSLTAIGALIWLTVTLLPIMLPFEIGLVLAYVTLPVVDWLNKWLPRSVSVALVMLGEFFLLGAFLAALIPVLINQVGVVLSDLPSQEERHSFFNALVVQLRAVLPPAAEDFIQNGVQQATQDLQDNAATYLGGLFGLLANGVLGIVGTVSFALSLLVLPTWLFSVMRDRSRAVRFVNSTLPESWRADFWAPLRIADRTLGFYLRGLVVQAIAVTVATAIGLQVLQALGYGPFRYPVLLAMVVGFSQLIPTFGPFVGYLLGGLAGLSHSSESAVAVVVMLIAVQILNNVLVASRVHNKVVDLHPAILAVLLVAGSQFGLLGVLLAAPLGVMFRDLFRYFHGRLSEPPKPAGLLPGPAGSTTATVSASTPTPTPATKTTSTATPQAVRGTATTQARMPQAARGTAQFRLPQSKGIPYRSQTPSPTGYTTRVQRQP